MSSPSRGERRELVRNALIESRLTPNAISLTGFVLCVVAAVLVAERLFFLAGVVFIIGSVCDTLDGRYSRMSGKGSPFGAFLDSTLDRIEEGVVLTTVAAYFASRDMRVRGRGLRRGRPGVADGLLHPCPRRGAGRRVQGRDRDARGPRRHPHRRPAVRQGRRSLADFELLAPAVYVLAGLSTITVLQRIFHVRKALTAPAAL